MKMNCYGPIIAQCTKKRRCPMGTEALGVTVGADARRGDRRG